MTFYFGDLLPYVGEFLQGLWVSVYITLLGMLVGSGCGLLLYVGRVSRMLVIRLISGGYIEAIRNTPLLVQLYLLYFGLPTFGIGLSPLWATLIGLTMNSAAYMAEIFRAGFSSTPVGQREAASALGLGPRQTFRYVLLVPAIRNIIPAATNQLVLVFLFSSIASFISLNELMNTVLNTGSQTALRFETLIVGGALYYVVSAVFARVAKLCERTLFRW